MLENPQQQSQVPSMPQIAPDTSLPPKTPTVSNKPAQRDSRPISLGVAYKAAGMLMDQQSQEIETRYRYANLNNAREADRIEGLKNINLDPSKLTNRADAVAFSYNRWKYVAADAQQRNPTKLREIATNYFNKEIAPYYAQLGIPDAMPLDLWLKQAYNPQGALRFQVEDAFNSPTTTGIFRGLHTAAGGLETLAGTAVNMLGTAMKGTSNLVRDLEINSTDPFKARGGEKQIPSYAPIARWHDELVNARAADEEAEKGMGFFQRAQARTQALDNPAKNLEGKSLREILKADPETFTETLGHDSKTFQHFADEDEFWTHINPSKGYKDTIASGVTELIATLPIFGAVRKGEQALLEAGMATLKTTERGAKVANTLTEVLNATPKGKWVARNLAAGGEGLGYGLLVRPNEDKEQAKYDALYFMIGENVFHFLGSRLKLRDVLAKFGDKTALRDHDTAMTLYKRGAEEGVRPANATERRQAYVAKHASDMAVVGKAGVWEHYKQAIAEIKFEEAKNVSPGDIEAKHTAEREHDPAGATSVQVAKGFVRDFLGDRKLKDLSEDEHRDLAHQIIELVKDAEDHLDRNAESIRTANAANVESKAGGPNAEVTKAHIRETLMQELQEKGVAKAAKPEEIEAEVEKRYKEAQAKAAAEAERRRGKNPQKEATAAADTRTEGDKLIRRSGQEVKGEGKSTITKATEGTGRFKVPPDAQASHNYKNYLVYLKGAAGGTGNQELTKFYTDMSSEDFEKELEEWMYPKALKDQGLHFEHEYTREGKQNPNFLAFMYNYADQMPAPMAKKLSTELEESLKFENNFKNSKPTEQQKWHYALQMYNHVDTFLGSTAYLQRGEKNIFRSTQSNLLNPTIFQVRLLEEMHKENLSLISEMFENPKEKTAARTAYKVFAGDMNDIFMKKPTLGSAQAFRQKADEAADWMTNISEKKLEHWRF